ncbi:rhodanese-like domain-containing protein [Lacunimicrobium album]
MRGYLIRIVCVAVVGLLTTSLSAAEWTKESLAEVKKAVEDGKAVLLDVREKSEWDAGHVEGAISLPISQLKDGISQEELDRLPKDKVIYVHCVVGKRALQATELLKPKKESLRAIKPGYKELIEAGFPKGK